MSGGLYPTPERIAKALILAAWRLDEVSTWIVHNDERVLRGEVELRSRYVALAALACLHPQASVEVMGRFIGFADGVADLRWAYGQGWWDHRLTEALMVAIVRVEDGPVENGFTTLKRDLTGLLADRVAIITRSGRNAS